MPNTKSAARRMRSNERKRQHNLAIRSRLKTLEKKLATLVMTGQAEDAQQALRTVASALDKAAKKGVIPANTASRKKSRLARQVGALKA